MTFDELLESRIREIVGEELQRANSNAARLFTPEELAERWQLDDKQAIYRLVRAGKLKAVKLSERNMRFTLDEVLRFEESGGVSEAAIG